MVLLVDNTFPNIIYLISLYNSRRQLSLAVGWESIHTF
nr:MAG TPA: hypothetical protein [Crassvirales sp.]